MEIVNDFYTSLRKAFSEIDPKWETYAGLVVAGTHHPRDIEKTLEKIRHARENGQPFLGICAGLQMAAVEFARNVIGIKGATSEEFGTGTFVIKEGFVPGPFVVKRLSGLRVGAHEVNGKLESFWHNFAVEELQEFAEHFELVKNKKILAGAGSESEIIDYMRLKDHPHFVACQFHPEYQSSIEKPHPRLVEFLQACKQISHDKLEM